MKLFHIECAPRISKSTFSSITTVYRDEEQFLYVNSLIKSLKDRVQSIYLKKVRDLPLDLGLSWVPTWKAIPSICDISLNTPAKDSSILNLMKFELASFGRDIRYIHSIQDGIFSPGILWRKTTLWPFNYSWNTAECNESLRQYEMKIGQLIDQSTSCFDGYFLYPGRLSQSLDGAGKRRIFAIGNYIRQRLLRPVHDWAMAALATLPTDGTYNQLAPIHRLVSHLKPNDKIDSFDLKSATDRWPLPVIYQCVATLFGPTLASSAVNATLGLNTFDMRSFLRTVKGFRERGPVLVSFSSGQPLGYLSSWPLFSLSHHWIVWAAANLVDPVKHRVFNRYALLGDDIVIADEQVALSYQSLLGKLGVSISPHKSLISDCGAFEFAKRFWVRSKDLSPVSAKAVLTVRSSLGLIQLADRYNITKFSTLSRLAGAGFRVRSRLMSSKARSRKWERLFVMASKPLGKTQLSLEWWLGRGKPLNPYLRGIIVELLRKELRPKELRLIPKELTFEGEQDFCSYTLLHNWMKLWLKWVHWYSKVALAPCPSIKELFDAPMISTSWKRSNFEPEMVKFGLLWRCYDMCAGWSLGRTPPCLPSCEIRFHKWILGGYKGTDFMMAPVVNQTTGVKGNLNKIQLFHIPLTYL